jgi:hypothetical protein
MQRVIFTCGSFRYTQFGCRDHMLPDIFIENNCMSVLSFFKWNAQSNLLHRILAFHGVCCEDSYWGLLGYGTVL